MSSSSSNVAPSSDSRGSLPNIDIERRSPSKVRLPSNTWTLVGRSQRPRASPAFNIDSPVEFPTLPPRAPSPVVPFDDDVFKGSVQVALR